MNDKPILAVLLLSGMFSGAVTGDWKSTLDDALDNAREYGEKVLDATREYGSRESWFRAGPRPLTEAEIEAQRQAQLRQIWGKTLRRLDEVRTLDARIETAPESRWFGEDRQSLRAERNDVFAVLAELLEDPHILEHRQRIDRLRQKIDTLGDQITALRERRVTALGDELEAIDADIAGIESDIARYRRAIGVERANLLKRFRAAGLVLDDAQLTALLARVDADDLIGMATTLETLKAITARLMTLMEASGEDLRQARRYYGMYVAMLEFVLHLQDSYLARLEQRYLPRIAKVLAETRRVQADSLRLLSSERAEARKSIVRRNLEAQQLTLKVARLYRRELERQKQRVEQAREVVRRDWQVAKNTYDTVRVGADLVRLMQVSQEAFAAVMAIQIPEIRPFENLQMQRKFEELSRLIDER